jgi:uncharacterized Fe-S cluster-containing MiaB family protein
MPQVSLPRQDVYESLVEQVNYILRNFDALVTRNQWGPVAWAGDKTDSIPVAFVLTPTGSFFDEIEFPLHVRTHILSILAKHSIETGIPIALHVETHAEHFLAASENQEGFAQTIDLLKRLNGRILFGFESSDAFVRNVLYNKFLEEAVFLSAAELAKSVGLGVGAFAFAGINPLNDAEILADSVKTLAFLHTHQIAPVLMFHNVQSYTIQELLFLYGAHTLPEPRTVLEVVNNLLQTTPDNRRGNIDSWLIADPVGGPPPPRYNIFASRKHVTCSRCTDAIYRAVVHLRQTRDVDAYLVVARDLAGCSCATSYVNLLQQQSKENSALIRRTADMVRIASDKVGDYVAVVRPIMNEVEEFSLFQDNVPRYGQLNDPAVDGPMLKAELLCYGIRIAPDLKEDLLRFNSYVHEAGFVHAAHFMIGTHLVNTCVAESFCEQSPYVLKRRNEHYELSKEGIIVAPCDVLPTPSWCGTVVDGFKLGDILRPHSRNVISGMPNPICCYFRSNEGCAFCSLGRLQNSRPIPPTTVAQAAVIARQHNPDYELALSGGTSHTPDRSASYFAEIARQITRETQMAISVELVPPESTDFLDELKASGVTSVILNIELWNQPLRSVYCPGKARIPLESYLKAIEHGTSLFGRGQVASVLIAGLQSPSAVVEGAREVISRGAIPTIIPFKPFDDCKMANAPRTRPEEVTEIHAAVADLLTQSQLGPRMQRGCTGCGGCSLENLQSRSGR